MSDSGNNQQNSVNVRRRSTPNALKPSKTQQTKNKEVIEEEIDTIQITQEPEQSDNPPIEDPKNPKIEDNFSNLWGLAEVGSEILENKASVARDHMANERTFLSWIRTSLGLATVGVGVTQLFKLVDENSSRQDEFLLKMGKPIGGAFIAIAILCVILGTLRFFKTQTLLKEEKYPVTRISALILVLLILSLSIVTLVAVLYSDTRHK